MRASALAFPLALLAAGCYPDPDAPLIPARATLGTADARVTLRFDRFGIRVENAAGEVVLDTFDDDAAVPGDDVSAYGALGATYHDTTFLPTISQGWDHVQGTDAPWRHATRVTSAYTTDTTAEVTLEDPADPGTTYLVTVAVEGAEVRFEAALTALSAAARGSAEQGTGPLNQMGQSFRIGADERFFGLGERYATVDHRGQRYGCWVEEGGIGQGEGSAPGPHNPSPNGPGMTHFPTPFVMSTRGYGLYLDTPYRTGFSLGADDPGLMRIQAEEPRLRWRLFVRPEPRALLADYTALTGRAKLPAPWVFGPRRRVDQGTLIDGIPEAEALRAQGVPTTMVDDTTHFLPVGRQVGHEAEIAAYNQRVHALGYKSIAYYNPYVSIDAPETADLVAHGRARDLFVKLEDGTEVQQLVVSSGPQTVATIDLTNPEAVTWYESLMQPALDLGYDGWMLDFGEYIPQQARMHDGRSGWEMHNAFPVLYDQVVFDYLTRVRGDDFMFFARAGYAGSQAFTPVVWSGDPAASFDDVKGLPAQVRAGVNAGLSGIPFWGSDISGYGCINEVSPDKELYLRWAAFGALSSDMHDENACASLPAGQPPKWTLWSDAETTKTYGAFARLHTRLFPYLYATAKEATETGLPVMRHPILMHPGLPEAAGVELEYYFGPSLYVAPVVRRGMTTRSLWLPPGKWIDWWTNAPVTGGATVDREAPLDVIPLYLRSGGVVAMLDPAVETLVPEDDAAVIGPTDVAGVLDVRAVIDRETGQGTATLADGTTLTVTLGAGEPALPEGVYPGDEAGLATCPSCGLIEPLPGGPTRVRVSVPSAAGASHQAGALGLRHEAAAPVRVRWDVVVVK